MITQIQMTIISILLCIIGGSIFFAILSGFTQWLDESDMDSYTRKLQKVTFPENKRSLYKMVRVLKKLLKRHSFVIGIQEILYAKSHNNEFLYKDLILKLYTTVWELTENRQLFTKKELEIIDRINRNAGFSAAQEKKEN